VQKPKNKTAFVEFSFRK